jgi:hypothetical protein
MSVNTGNGTSLGWHSIPVDMASEEQQTATKPEENSTTDSDAAHAD